MLPRYDPHCYMCPGNRRASGQVNPSYTSTFVFDNDFPALTAGPMGPHEETGTLLRARGESGICRVLCYSPRHDVTLSTMDVAAVEAVVACWIAELETLRRSPAIRYVQIFENRGEMMGASNPHPHGQIWATSFVPDEVALECGTQRAYAVRHSTDLLGAYIDTEAHCPERIVAANRQFVCIVPFWATWPFETLIVPRRFAASLEALDAGERQALAAMLQHITRVYDRLFDAPFPYSMGVHVAPDATIGGFRFHVHFYPPLLRSATVKKFMVGFELLANAQRDLTPERAAQRLRDLG